MTDHKQNVEDIARGIVDKVMPDKLWIESLKVYVDIVDWKVRLAAALREYAEEIRTETDRVWADLVVKADVEGYRRGVEEAAKKADWYGKKCGDAVRELQRGQAGERG